LAQIRTLNCYSRVPIEREYNRFVITNFGIWVVYQGILSKNTSEYPHYPIGGNSK
jgi:hypothetical protein